MSVPCFVNTVARSFVGVGASGLLRPGSLCSCRRVTRKIMSRRQSDHLERTASNYRQMDLFPAKVSGIVNESDTVKRLRLEVLHPDFSFRAGQWVDFFIPGLDKVGGFSICSSPDLLKREGVMELAVKYAQHPPAQWVHTRCVVDSRVEVRVGGDFYFDPSPADPAVDLLLLAGGVGINPVYSILLHAADLLRHTLTDGHGYTPGNTHLCYSAKTTHNLLFKNTIIDVCREFPEKFSCNFHITQKNSHIQPELQPYTSCGRISEAVLRQHVDPVRTLCYLCGPPPMIEGVSAQLRSLGLSESRILYEKWW